MDEKNVKRLLGKKKFVQVNLINGFKNLQGWAPVSVYKDITGRVFINGMVTGGDIGKTIFLLPEGFRPKYAECFAVKIYGSTARVDVYNNGGVHLQIPPKLAGKAKRNYYVYAPAGWLSLSGVSFLAA